MTEVSRGPSERRKGPAGGAARSVRTCVGCRQSVPARDLVRVTLGAGILVWGKRRQQAGRGASLHPQETCVRAAVKNHGFARAFRAAVPRIGIEDVAALFEEISVAYQLQLRRNG